MESRTASSSATAGVPMNSRKVRGWLPSVMVSSAIARTSMRITGSVMR